MTQPMKLPAPLIRVLGACVALAFVSCGPAKPVDPAASACRSLIAGDLVVTEFLADPPGADDGQEWIEVYNATTGKLDLKGLTVYASRTDGSAEKAHTIASGTVEPGKYFVLGSQAAADVPTYVNYAFGEALGALPNTKGRLGLRCVKTVIDEVNYDEAAKTGHSSSLNGDRVPDSAGNDDAANFCDGSVEYSPGLFGTPGNKNSSCGVTTGPTSCLDPKSGTSRAVKAPTPGELVITEFMANPVGTDSDGEWIEIKATSDVDLNGLVLSNGTAKTTLNAEGCLRLGTGSYALFARKADSAVNGGLPAAVALFTFDIKNSNGSLSLLAGGTVVDQVTYAATSEGVSLQVDPAKSDAISNDSPTSFCGSTAGYGTSTNKGSPGSDNITCPAIPDPNTCTDAVSGLSRAIVKPAVGDLVITEVMASPEGTDSDREWFEVMATRSVDLNNLSLSNGSTSKSVLASTQCVRVPAGAYVVFARTDNLAATGGLTEVTWTFNFDLTSTETSSVALALDTVVLDAATYGIGPTGASRQLHTAKLDTVSNDQSASFCDSPTSAVYGAGGRGTPGKINAACP
jgi:hypothetical protein